VIIIVNVMSKVVELIILGVGILVYYTGFNAAVIAALPNETVGGAIAGAMSTILTVVPALVFLFIGIEIAFPGAISKRIG
jgi:hypothetical protein